MSATDRVKPNLDSQQFAEQGQAGVRQAVMGHGDLQPIAAVSV